MATLLDVLNAFSTSVVTFNTLKPQHITRENIFAGNNVVVCRCMEQTRGLDMALRCYPRRRRNASAIYGSSYLPDELNICALNSVREVIDVVAMPWVEGVSLDKLLCRPRTDYGKLSKTFDSLALRMLVSPRTHGDIKPANIIVTPRGDMHFIDYDAAWLPGFTLADADEVGTPTFSHPQRGVDFFDKRVDDFAISLVSVMLAALACKRDRFEPYVKNDGSLFVPKDVLDGDDALLNATLSLFERKGDMAHYHIARMLYQCDGHVDGLVYALSEALRR